MKISVCMAVYNGTDFIEEQLKSILYQTMKVDEVIIINDSSIDDTIEKINNFKNKLNIVLIDNKSNIGVIRSFEKALINSSGDYIFLCDQDDVWEKDKVERMISKLSDNNQLVISNYELIDRDTNKLNKVIRINKDELSLINTLIKNKFIGCSMAFDKKLLNLALPFPNSIPMHDSWLGMIATYYSNVGVLDEVTLQYRKHDNNVTGERGNIYKMFKQRFNLALCFLFRLIKIKVS